jgi:hypothetical protein
MMKMRLMYLGIAIIIAVSACKKDNSSNPDMSPKGDSLVSGAGYANDVYYSLANGVVKITPRNNWDLAFSTPSRSISILINGGMGDSLFLWTGGALADFNSASELTISGPRATNFDDTTWFNSSAFEQGVNTANPLDFGWGIYNTNTHDVEGDSVYILKLSNGAYKKIAILNRLAVDHSYKFLIANLANGAAIDTVTIATASSMTKNFVYYSIGSKQIINDREPDNTKWDFMFTKYDSRSNQQYYPLVTGILVNEGVTTSKLSGADTTKTYNQVTFSKKISEIGSDWKHFNNSTYTYDIVNPYYFIKGLDKHYYQLKIKSFDYTVGRMNFVKTLVK